MRQIYLLFSLLLCCNTLCWLQNQRRPWTERWILQGFQQRKVYESLFATLCRFEIAICKVQSNRMVSLCRAGGMLNVPYQRVCIEKTQNPMLTDLHQHKQRPMACHWCTTWHLYGIGPCGFSEKPFMQGRIPYAIIWLLIFHSFFILKSQIQRFTAQDLASFYACIMCVQSLRPKNIMI